MGSLDTERDWSRIKFVYPGNELLQALRALANTLNLVYRTNTFPLVHAGFFHAFMNILALTPLLERFEAEHGTLVTLALFMGRK